MLLDVLHLCAGFSLIIPHASGKAQGHPAGPLRAPLPRKRKNPQPRHHQGLAETYTRQDSNLWPSESEWVEKASKINGFKAFGEHCVRVEINH